MIILYIINFLGFCAYSMLFPIVPLYVAHLGAPVSEVGIIVGVMNYVPALLMIPSGVLADRIGKVYTVMAGLALFLVAPVLYPLASDPQQLIPLRILNGLGFALYLPSLIALAVDVAPVKKRAESLGWFSATGQLGNMAGPIIGGLALRYADYTIAFYMCSLVALIALITTFAKLKQFRIKPNYIGQSGAAKDMLRHPLFLAVLAVPLAAGIGTSTLSTYIPLYGKTIAIDEVGAGLIIAIYFLSSSLLRGPSGKMADTHGPKRIILWGLAIFAVSMLVFSQLQTMLWLSAAALVLGLGFGMMMPAGLAFIADMASPQVRGLASSMYTAFFQVGASVGATALGFVVAGAGYPMMFIVSGLTIGACLLVVVSFLRRKM